MDIRDNVVAVALLPTTILLHSLQAIGPVPIACMRAPERIRRVLIMIRVRARLMASLVMLFFSALLQAATYEGSLSAQFTGIEPAQPLAGVPFRANVLAGPCEYLSAVPDSATLLSQESGVVTIRIPGALDISCNQDIAPRQFLLPALPAGNYRVDLVLYMVEFPGDPGAPAGYIGGRDVQVLASASTTSIPTLGASELAVFVALVLLVGVAALRRARGTLGWRGPWLSPGNCH